MIGFNFENEEFLILKNYVWGSRETSYTYDNDHVVFELKWEHTRNPEPGLGYYINMFTGLTNVYEGTSLEDVQRKIIVGVLNG